MPESLTDIYFKTEKANVITHVPGIFLALAGTPILAKMAMENDASSGQFYGILIYGISMLMVYAASVFYHSVHDPARKALCRKLDHIAIFFLIAGTQTPIILRYLDEPKGWIYLAIVWATGLAGAIGKVAALGKWPKLSLTLYIFMGWMFVFILPAIWPVIEKDVLIWVVVGGLAYCGGAVFYAIKKPLYFHNIWHLFVLAGSAGHYVAVWKAFN